MANRDRLLTPLYRLYEGRLERDLKPEVVPRHIGIILDGHRRYARSEGLPDYTASYRVGMRKFEEFLGWAHDLSVPAITGWLLSTHNLQRPAEELQPYFEVLIELFDRLPQLAIKQDMAVRFIGSLDLLPAELVNAAKTLEERCSEGARRLTMAVGYGGRQEIVDAVKELVADLINEGTAPAEVADHIDIDSVQAHLYTAGLPDPDLVIRTSGESRLSGFLLWQSAYAEYVFVDVYWPAFRRVDFLRSVRDFARRERRFGK
ncbi:MAG: di-trans,poly-cis-decaprenylcistransferase [Acidimicrobiia bacterium]|nr:di-trans,poly-cis-decaprenylcistransferase [Acidimicrobiia bacterium]